MSSPAPVPPPTRQSAHAPPGAEIREGYQAVADTIGGVPNLRWKDNFYQTVFILVFTSACAITGYFLGGLIPGVLFGTFIGLVSSFLISGTVLMVLGWVRAAKYVSKKAASAPPPRPPGPH